MHEMPISDFELPDIEEWYAGDSRQIAFRVLDESENPVDISDATVEWYLFEREYQTDAADAILSGADSGVELVTDNRVDTTNGEWEVRVDADATDGDWGELYHRPAVEQPDGSRSEWLGTVILTA